MTLVHPTLGSASQLRPHRVFSLAGWLAAIARYRSRRQAIRQYTDLIACEDHVLRDIGIDRTQVLRALDAELRQR